MNSFRLPSKKKHTQIYINKNYNIHIHIFFSLQSFRDIVTSDTTQHQPTDRPTKRK